MNMRTAKLREKARLYESRCEWALAAQCWQSALDHYPPTPGALAEHDRQVIEGHARECRASAAREAI